jgi:hypothetical protein
MIDEEQPAIAAPYIVQYQEEVEPDSEEKEEMAAFSDTAASSIPRRPPPRV